MSCEQFKSQLEQLRTQQAEAQTEFRDLVGSAKRGSPLRAEILALGKKIAAKQAQLNQCLAKNPEPNGYLAAFHPETDGFLFNNNWTWDPTEEATLRKIISDALPAVEAVLSPIISVILSPLVPPDPIVLGAALLAANSKIKEGITNAILQGDNRTYGLCGGMAFTALDYWHKQWVVPQGEGLLDHPERVTPNGTVLRDYIWTRLINSLQLNVGTFLKWMGVLITGGEKWLVEQTADQLVILRNSLKSFTPVPLGLIGTTSNPFHNHQVLCYGYMDNSDGTTSLSIYDENHPGVVSIIKLDVRGPVLKAVHDDTFNKARGPLRGVFCEGYKAAEPPKSVVLRNALQVEPTSAGINQPISVHYTAANVGFHTAPLNLVVSTDKGALVGEADPTSIAMGGERTLTEQIKISTAGDHQIAAAAEQTFGANGEMHIVKVLPPEVGRVVETITVKIKA
jgi:hypothetical protein